MHLNIRAENKIYNKGMPLTKRLFQMMKLYDITRVLDENTPVYPGDPAFDKQVFNKHGFIICRITMSTHAGTHMDAPSHLEGGALTIADIPLHKLIGLCAVCDTYGDVLNAVENGIYKILYRGDSDNLQDIAALAIELIGVENLSVGDYEMHKAFLSKNIVVVEGLVFGHVPKGRYMLIAMPLKTQLDGSPARVALVQTEDGLL